MRPLRTAVVTFAVALVLATAAFAGTKLLTGIPLQWKPTTSFDDLKVGAIDLTPFGNAKIEVAALGDSRTKDKALIGENHEDEKKGVVKDVRTNDDVPAFVTAHLKEVLTHYGLPIVDGKGTVKITGEVLDFFVLEKDTYDGSVRLKITVHDAAGKVLWTGIAAGTSHRFGRSYKAENYYETLSDATLEAAAELLRSSEFLHAAAGKK